MVYGFEYWEDEIIKKKKSLLMKIYQLKMLEILCKKIKSILYAL